MDDKNRFPDDFYWGAAAASYQIEGAHNADGKGPSVWDVFCTKPGAVKGGETGEVACDHYHRYQEDVDLMKQIGLKAYRLSVSWPRVIPEGTGRVNPAGMDFYDRLVDSLLEASVTPFITLFHWDYPQTLFSRGGWLNPASPNWFAEYAELVVGRLGDRVQNWLTLNEPTFFIWLGHWTGVNAPGLKLSQGEVLQVLHNTLLAHGKGVQAIRASSPVDCRVGLAATGFVGLPSGETEDEIELARSGMFSVPLDDQRQQNSLVMDPIFLGKYPDAAEVSFGKDMPHIRPGDMETIHQPLDFLGYNIYEGWNLNPTQDGQFAIVPQPVGAPRTAAYWQMSPELCYWGPRFLYERYGMPILVTENGISGADWIMLDGKIHDPERIDFMRRNLLNLRKAMQEGVPVMGYFYWSILDNFEWQLGFKERFGLIFVDYQSQKRTPKDSAWWYKRVIESGGAALDEDIYII